MHLLTVATKSSSITVHQGSPFICFMFSLGIPSPHNWMSTRKTALQINGLLGIYIFSYCMAFMYHYYMHYVSPKMNKVSMQQKPPCVSPLYDQDKPTALASEWEICLETRKPLEDREKHLQLLDCTAKWMCWNMQLTQCEHWAWDLLYSTLMLPPDVEHNHAVINNIEVGSLSRGRKSNVLQQRDSSPPGFICGGEKAPTLLL